MQIVKLKEWKESKEHAKEVIERFKAWGKNLEYKKSFKFTFSEDYNHVKDFYPDLIIRIFCAFPNFDNQEETICFKYKQAIPFYEFEKMNQRQFLNFIAEKIADIEIKEMNLFLKNIYKNNFTS